MSDGTAPADSAEAPRPDRTVHPKPPSPVSEAPRRRASNLALRLLTAGMLIPPLLWIIAQGGVWVLGTVIVITLLGLHEFYQLIEEKGAHPLRSYGYAAGAALPVVMYFGNESLATVLMTAVLLAMMFSQLTKARITEALASISGTFFGVFYVGWLLSHVVVLREFASVVETRWPAARTSGIDPDVGAFYLLFCIATVIFGDVGAYFTGRAYGRRKLAPQISPNKTVEGAVGAILAGIVMGLALKAGFDWFAPSLSAQLSYTAVLVISPLLAGVGIIGDLIESLLKRDAQVKDTGTLLPGTGGVLDRIDSNLTAIPVMYYLMLAYTFLKVG